MRKQDVITHISRLLPGPLTDVHKGGMYLDFVFLQIKRLPPKPELLTQARERLKANKPYIQKYKIETLSTVAQ